MTKRVFLTGASSGIGLAIAQLLVAQGHEVWGTSRKLERMPKSAPWHAVRLDLADPMSIKEAFNAALEKAGHFDVLINNAGAGHFGPAELLRQETITSQFQILVFGQIQLMDLALQHMQARGEGLIINVTSLASRLPVPFMAAYNAAKAAMASFSMSTQIELGNSKVHVVDLQPGNIRTDFNQGVTTNVSEPGRYSEKVAKVWDITERTMKNAPLPEIVARQVLRLINEDQPPPRVTVGDVFESKVAPLIFRFLPQRVRVWGLKRHYGI
jgi:NAD(P)-dependent dehydrogenase (short-subunit alcohol dehydrogenase family)